MSNPNGHIVDQIDVALKLRNLDLEIAKARIAVSLKLGVLKY